MFISPIKFLNQNEKVQNIILNCWIPELGDLFFALDRNNKENIKREDVIFDNETLMDVENNKGYYKPIMTESMLRKIIESKTGGFITYNLNEQRTKYHIMVEIIGEKRNSLFDVDANNMDLLQAYWILLLKMIEAGLIE